MSSLDKYVQNTNYNKIECKTVVEDANIVETQRKGFFFSQYLFSEVGNLQRIYKEVDTFEQDLPNVKVLRQRISHGEGKG